ncbi:alkylglycerol monooxygenase isoform X2 [Conger conger]|uniref:alkylglycerol monooxygenase isoform X2 n=1 Tax=Conger conger TaxID=82655 RepID=UPI002A5A077B|nr:alkylglycerol monooxygenase isoform X2 [Conger conger]
MATVVETPASTLNHVVRTMFYLVTPNETSFQHIDEVPDYVDKATPVFLGMLILELVLGWAKTGSLIIRINDGVTSVSAGFLSRIPLLFVRSLELSSYIYIWNNYRLLELPWDSPWTWWLVFLGVDLAYYWLHRFSHELNVLWAAHQAHHSSEDYNLSTALRQSLTQQLASWVLHLPMALAVPPTVFAVHIQFNLLYQFWIHTEVIRHLGPLEWVMNTPSHHRVHHGRNPYCIDKNYGGTLIIWDRIFGTFAPEGDKVVYGLTKPINSFDIIYVQFHYYPYIWRRFWRATGIKHKLSVIFKGPSWRPNKPRLGDRTQLPKVTGKEVPYNPTWPLVLQAYVLLQFLLLLAVYTDVMAMKLILSQQTLLLLAGYIILTLTSLGLLIEQRPKAAVLEMFRCALFLALCRFGFVKPAVPSMVIEEVHTLRISCSHGRGIWLMIT